MKINQESGTLDNIEIHVNNLLDQADIEIKLINKKFSKQYYYDFEEDEPIKSAKATYKYSKPTLNEVPTAYERICLDCPKKSYAMHENRDSILPTEPSTFIENLPLTT